MASGDIENISAENIFYVTPSQYFYNILTMHKSTIDKKSKVIICSKGIDINTGFLMSNIYTQVLKNNNYCILSGPSFASEVANGLPAALVLASPNMKEAIKTANFISSRNFRIYPSDDVIGVQLGGAIKNIYAIGAGIVKGINYGENARSAFLTRSIAEMAKICISMGGKKESIFGLSGVGDVLLTCNSEVSRNFLLGTKIGKGELIDTILSKNITVAEGYYTSRALFSILKNKKIDTPIMTGVYNILYNELSVKSAVDTLLDRPIKIGEFN